MKLKVLDNEDGGSLREAVYQTLKNSILTGELAPDERLMEIPIAHTLGVSRTPVREAIRRLEKEQLVVINPRCGARVAAITDKDVKDALKVRIVAEDMAVRLAAASITKEQLDNMRFHNEQMHIAMKQGDIQRISDEDNLLHEIIFEAAGNRVLRLMNDMLEEHVLRYRVEYIRRLHNYDALIEEHNEIIHAIEAGDELEASRLLTEHITRQRDCICRIIQEKSE